MDPNSLIPGNPAELMQLFGPLANEGTTCATMGGFAMPPYFGAFWPAIYNFPIQSEDVLIATFPKSGTTWMQQIVYLLVTSDFDGATKIPIDVRVPFMEFPFPTLPAVIAGWAAQKPPRLLKTHLPAKFLPKDMAKGKLIYIYRNAKDTAVSGYYHFKAMSSTGLVSNETTFEQFVRNILAEKVAYAPYDKHVLGYYELSKNPGQQQMLFLKFEEMKADTRAVIRKVAQFLGKPIDDATLEKIYEATTADAMRNNDAANYSWYEKIGIWNGTPFIRKGIVGDWRNHFTDAKLLADFDAWLKKSLPEELYKLQE